MDAPARSSLPAPVRNLLEWIGDTTRPLAELPADARDALLAGVADGLIDCYSPLLRAVHRLNLRRHGVPMPTPDAAGRVADVLSLLKSPVGDVVRLTPIGRAALARDRVATTPASPDAGDDEAMLSAGALAERFGVPAAPLRKRLERWRRKHDAGWQEVANGAARGARTLYRVGSVRPLIDSLRASI